MSGIRIVALILSTTGISLLAYMETNHNILVSVVLGTASAVGTAVYKVMFKKVMGEVNFLEVSIFFSVRYKVPINQNHAVIFMRLPLCG